MQKYGRLNPTRVVVETFTPHLKDAQSETYFDIAECMHGDLLAQFQPVPEFVEPGWTLSEDGQNWAAPVPYVAPPAPPAPPAPRHITKLAFRNRFSQAEKVAIDFASMDDPAAATASRQQAAALRAELKDQENAAYIDLDRADTRTGVQSLEALGLLAVGRAAQILDAAIQPQEVYLG